MKPTRDDLFRWARAAVFIVIFLTMGWRLYRTVGHNDGLALLWTDSYSYINDAQALASGIPGLWRTPAYPLLMNLCNLIAGPGGALRLMPPFQTLVLFVSMFAFYGVARRLTGTHRYVALLTTLAMGLCSPLCFTNQLLLPESLTVSCMIFMIWSLMRDFDRPAPAGALRDSLLLTVMIALKPVYIFMIPIVAATWIYIFVTDRRNHRAKAGLVTALTLSTALTLTVFGYREWMRQTYGAPMLTVATVVNDVMLGGLHGVIVPSEVEDPVAREIIEECVVSWNDRHDNPVFVWPQMAAEVSLHPAELQKAAADAFRRHPDRVAAYTVGNLGIIFGGVLKDAKYFKPLTYYWRRQVMVLVYAVTMALWVIVTLVGRRWRRPGFGRELVLGAIGWGMIAVVAYGTYGEWTRLLLAGFPAAYLLGGMMVSMAIRPNMNFRRKHS